jgi:chromosome segregation ATPase
MARPDDLDLGVDVEDLLLDSEQLNLLHGLNRLVRQEGNRIMASLDNVVTILQAVSDDEAKVAADVETLIESVASLQQQIADLQSAAGTFTPEQQAQIDAIAASAQGIDDNLNTLDASISTPPVPPAE